MEAMHSVGLKLVEEPSEESLHISPADVTQSGIAEMRNEIIGNGKQSLLFGRGLEYAVFADL
jgi:hypothetical protein